MLNSPPFNPVLLGIEDPPPFVCLNPEGQSHIVLICDHASHAVPQHMSGLGLGERDLNRHIAWDIGAAEVTSHMARHLNATAFLAGYSRLIIDCNRPPNSPTSIPPVSDGSAIPANRAVSEQEALARADALFWPYHRRIADTLDHLIEHAANGADIPILVAIHSFTPQLDAGAHRPWHIGLLFEHDARLVAPLRTALETQVPNIFIGENEPYAIIGPSDYSIPEHGQSRGLPHIEIEIRQDLIDTPDGVLLWARRIAGALQTVCSENKPFKMISPINSIV